MILLSNSFSKFCTSPYCAWSTWSTFYFSNTLMITCKKKFYENIFLCSFYVRGARLMRFRMFKSSTVSVNRGMRENARWYGARLRAFRNFNTAECNVTRHVTELKVLKISNILQKCFASLLSASQTIVKYSNNRKINISLTNRMPLCLLWSTKIIFLSLLF